MHHVTSTLTLLQCSHTAYAIQSKLLTSEIELLGKKYFTITVSVGEYLMKNVFLKKNKWENESLLFWQ